MKYGTCYNMLTAKHFATKEITFIDGGKIDYLRKGKNLIIEFVGLTGSGKTTNCSSFSDFFSKQNLNVYTFQDIKHYLYQRSFYRRLCIYLKTLFEHSPDFLAFFLLLASHRVYSFDSIYRYMKLCIFNNVLHQFIRTRKVDALLLDQWIIQGLWSATIFKVHSFNKLQDELKRFYFKTDYVLYFDIDEETACERIQSRDSGKSRFDKMDYENKLAQLKRYNPYLYRMFENSDCPNKFEFSTKVSPGKNAEDFFHQFEYSVIQGK